MTIVRVYRYRCVGYVNGRIQYRIRVIAKSFGDAEATALKWEQEHVFHVNEKITWETHRVSDMNALFADLGR